MPGQNIQHYTDLVKLGEGGMGVVFKARDTRLHRTVVIKALHPDRAKDPDPRHRFFQEARAASALNHPNIVTIYDIGSENNVDFIVMEYVDGSPLDVLLMNGPLKPDVAVRFGTQIGDALSAAHRHGIIHRDLKPGNIVINASGHVKLLDFGLAKLTTATSGLEALRSAEASPITAEGCIVGTAAYMAPEQALGKPVNASTDLFSLGAVLYEMLTGRRAFDGDSAISTLTAVLRDEPTDICLLNHEVPQPLADVVYRCLRKNPEDRYASAADFKKDLEGALDKPVARGAHQPVIAVTPFQNFTTEPNDFFAAGLMQELAAALAAASGLRVTSKSSRNADGILEGSIRKSGSRVRVLAQLVDPAVGQPMWTERYDRELTDLFKTQDEIAKLIVAAVRKRLSAVPPVLNEGLLELKRFTPASLSIARDCFERAIREDRENPAIYVAMADYYAAAAVLAIREPKQLLPKAEWAAKRALELDPGDAGPHPALAIVQAIGHCQWDKAVIHFRRCLENEATVFQPYLFVLAPGFREVPGGRLPAALSYRAMAQYLAGNSETAYRHTQSVLQIDSHFWPAAFVQSLADSESEPPLGILWSYGVQARRSPESAQDVIDALTPQRDTRYIPSSLFATAYLTQGQLDKAFVALDRAAAERDPMLPSILLDPALEPLREDSRLVALVQKVGLSAGRHMVGA